MKKNICFLVLIFISHLVRSHDIHYNHVNLKQWNIEKENRSVEGSFFMLKDDVVYIEDRNDRLVSFPLHSLSPADQSYVMRKYDHLRQINHAVSQPEVNKISARNKLNTSIVVSFFFLLAGAVASFLFVKKPKWRFSLPVLMAAGSMFVFGFGQKFSRSFQVSTSPAFIDSAFTPFKPYVNTFWDTTYFYVESKGIPTTHGMMVGISNHGWQQQVPIPQCYIGNNAWPIPLNPVMSANPIPVDSIHFTRGAIAIAANGVPIFNVHTNTGVDSYLDGQLDNYGGHCGRADDYHYHIAPLHLYSGFTPTSLPCAFGLDGFPVYGNVEPDGSAMQTLDANHGHFYNGTYHYHGTPAAPYMIARMAGVVTEDATHQLIPQAAAHPVRPSLTPLNGALITGCTPNQANNGYTLTYTLNSQTDSIVYFWNLSGQYTFNFYTSGNGIPTTQTYNGFSQCVVPTGISTIENNYSGFTVYPNPGKGLIHISPPAGIKPAEIRKVTVSDSKGNRIFTYNQFMAEMDLSSLTNGMYIIQMETAKTRISQKIIIGDQW